MEIAATLIPPKSTSVFRPELSFGSDKEYFLHVGNGFEDMEFVQAFIDRFDSMGWLRRSYGRRIGEPHKHWLADRADISSGYTPTSRAEKEAQSLGIPIGSAGLVSAILGANLQSIVDLAFVLDSIPNRDVVNLTGFYGVPTLYAHSYDDLSKKIGKFMERVSQ